MSFGGGTNFGEITAKTFTLASTSLGDIILVEFWSETDTDYMTGISGGGVTWDASAMVAHTEYTGAPGTATAWKGEVTTAEGGGGATVTITTNTGSPTVRGLWTEVSTTAGYANVALDQSESTSGTTTVAGMTAGHGAGELLWGWQFNSSSGTATQNTPSGFTYNGTVGDSHGNVGYWNLDCGTGSEAPTIGGGGDLYGLSVMLYETSSPATVALTAPNIALAAPLLTPSGGGTVALTAPNAALAAPLVTPVTGKSVALTAPGVALAAPLLAVSGGATVALTAPNLALAAPLVTPPAPPPPPSFPDPAGQLDLRLELNAGGTWTDVTSDCDHGPMTVGRGHPDESTTVSPATFGATLTNSTARYSPDNPVSDLWPWCVQNMPVRVSVPASASYLRLEFDTGSDGAQVADTAALHVTGSIEMRTALQVTDWEGGVLACRRDGTTGSWHWTLNTDGTLQFGWWDSGGTFWLVNSSAPLPFLSGVMALRVTLNASTALVTFYYAAGSSSLDPASWTQLGTVQSPGLSSTSVRAGNCPLEVGFSTTLGDYTDGSVYGYRLYNGIGGTVVADAAFSSQAAGATSWTDAYGLAWSLSGDAEISDRNYRGHFEASELPQEEPEYNPDAANDGSVEVDALVPLVGAGLLRRYGQRAPVLESPMKRSLLAAGGTLECVAVWPCEPDTSSTSQLSSAVPGAAPGAYVSGTPTLDGSTPFGGASQALPAINGSQWHFTVPPYTSNGSIVVRCLVDFADNPGTGNAWTLFQVILTGNPCNFVNVVVYDPSDYSSNDIALAIIGYTYGSPATQVFTSTVHTNWNALTGTPNSNTAFWVSLEMQEVSGNVQYSLVLLPQNATGAGGTGNYDVSGSVGKVTDIYVNPYNVAFDSTVAGMMSVQSGWESMFDFTAQLNAYLGEPAGARFARLCAENDVTYRIRGNTADTAPMGAQASDTLVNLLQACAAADMGVWKELRQVLGWGYVTRKALYNQPATATVSYLSDHLSPWTAPPTRDDQVIVNDVTVVNDISGSAVSTTGSSVGASVRVYAAPGQPIAGGRMSTVAPAAGGIGSYAQSYNIPLAADDLLPDEAGWLLHLGTADQPRLPGILIDLANEDAAAIYDAVLDLDLGDRLVITDPPRRLGFEPVTQLAQQLTETLWYDTLTIGIAGVPELPYQVAGAAGMHLAPPAGALSSGVSTTATSWSVAASSTDSTQLWSTNAADYPQDWMVEGERVTVTAMTGSSSPQTATVTRSVSGVVKSHSSGAAVTTWPPPVIGL